MIINYQNKYFSFQDLFVCAYVCVCTRHVYCVYTFMHRSGEVIRFLGAGVSGSCELPDMGDEIRTQILWGSRRCSSQ